MRKLLFVIFSCVVLSACNTVSNVNANDFLTAKAHQPSKDMQGVWTGAMGPYLNTLKIDNDGTGKFCYSWNGKNVDGKLVFDGVDIIYQSGEKLEVKNITNQEMYLFANYYYGANYIFYKDSNLAKASSYCQSFFE